jgi:hypothetical protein
MPDTLTPLLAGAALLAVYALGYAALGALAALIDGHAPRASVRDLRRRAVIGTPHTAVTARARRVVAADRRLARAAAAPLGGEVQA